MGEEARRERSVGSTGNVGGVGVGEGRLQQAVCCSVRDETGDGKWR